MRNWRTNEGNAENKVGMRGIGWERLRGINVGMREIWVEMQKK